MRWTRSGLWMLCASLLMAALAFWLLQPPDPGSTDEDSATAPAGTRGVEVQPRLEGQAGASQRGGASNGEAGGSRGGTQAGEPGLLLTVLTPEGKPLPRGFVNVASYQEAPFTKERLVGPTISAPIGEQEPWLWGPRPRVAGSHVPASLSAREGWRHTRAALRRGQVTIRHDEGRPYVLVRVRPEGEAIARFDKFARSRTDLLPVTIGFRFDANTFSRSASITLERGMLIQGIVLDEDGEPADEARVELRPLVPGRQGTRTITTQTDRSGRFAFGRLIASAYDLRAASLGGWGRVIIKEPPTEPLVVQCGETAGPYCVFRDRWGNGVSHGALDRASKVLFGRHSGWVHGPEPLHLSPSAVGRDIEVRASGAADYDSAMTLSWKIRVANGEHVLTVPESREASVVLERADGEPFSDDTPWRKLTLRLTGARREGEPSTEFSVPLGGPRTPLRLPEGRYDLEIESKAAGFSSVRVAGAVVVPGGNRVTLSPRRTVRVRIVGAAVHAARLAFFVDGARLESPAGVRTTGPGEVMLEGLDAGASEVVAMMRAAAGTDNPNVAFGWPKDMPQAASRHVGRAPLAGDEAVITMQEGACLRFTLPSGSRWKGGDQATLRGWAGLLLQIYDGENLVHQVLARQGPTFGYPEGELVSPPLFPGRYRAKVTPLTRQELALLRVLDRGVTLLTFWTVDGLVPGDAPHALEPLTEK